MSGIWVNEKKIPLSTDLICQCISHFLIKMPLLARWQWETWTQRQNLSRFTSSTHSSASPTATFSAHLDSLPSLFGTLQASFRCCATHEYDTCGNRSGATHFSYKNVATHQALTFPGTAGSSSLPWSGCKKTEGAKLGQG